MQGPAYIPESGYFKENEAVADPRWRMSTAKKTAAYPADGIVWKLAAGYDDFNLFYL
jgi:hypothetical protein